jgi:hypothetical protein
VGDTTNFSQILLGRRNRLCIIFLVGNEFKKQKVVGRGEGVGGGGWGGGGENRGLADRLKDLNNLLYLYPNTPKDQAFSKYYSEKGQFTTM